MKKIYLDWNVFTHINEVAGLFDFIIKNLNHFVFVYSPAHFDDLMQSYKEDDSNKYFDTDLKRLGAICETHLMRFDEAKNRLDIFKCSPKEYFESDGQNYPIYKGVFNLSVFNQSQDDSLGLISIIQDNLKSNEIGKTIDIPFIGSFSNAWEFLVCVLAFIDKLLSDETFYKRFRASMTKDLKEADVSWINNKSPENVINAIKDFFNKYGVDKDFKEIVRDALPTDKKENHKLFFQSLYLMLDLMRYRSDKRPMANIIADAEHAYYGSYCDVLVTNDDRMRRKTQAVYACLGIQTKIICKEELLQYLKDEIIKELRIDEQSLKEVLSGQHFPEEYNEKDVYMKYICLDHPFLSFFDRLEYHHCCSTGDSCLAFTKELRYTYFTEAEKLFKIIKGVLHEADLIKSFEKEYIDKFRANDKFATFSFDFGPTLQMGLAVCEEGDCLIPIMYLLPKSVSAQPK